MELRLLQWIVFLFFATEPKLIVHTYILGRRWFLGFLRNSISSWNFDKKTSRAIFQFVPCLHRKRKWCWSNILDGKECARTHKMVVLPLNQLFQQLQDIKLTVVLVNSAFCAFLHTFLRPECKTSDYVFSAQSPIRDLICEQKMDALINSVTSLQRGSAPLLKFDPFVFKSTGLHFKLGNPSLFIQSHCSASPLILATHQNSRRGSLLPGTEGWCTLAGGEGVGGGIKENPSPRRKKSGRQG